MAYDGYFKFGETEIINTARTAAYVDRLMPTFGLADCTDCEGLAQATDAPSGGFRTPVLDGAPWVDGSNPALNDFWGVYPMDVAGIDDSTRTLTMTELLGDGGVASAPRRTSREIRYDVMLLGRTEASVKAGLHWLDRALDAHRCSSPQALGCTGTELDFFSACPPACDYSACPDEVVTWDQGAPLRYNWVRNPAPNNFTPTQVPWAAYGDGSLSYTFGGVRQSWPSAAAVDQESGVQYVGTGAFTPNPYPTEVARNLVLNPSTDVDSTGWSSYLGSSEVATFARRTTGDGPEYVPGYTPFAYMRRTVTTAKTGALSGVRYTRSGMDAIPVGTSLAGSVWVRSSVNLTLNFAIESRQGAAGTTVVSTPVSLVAGVWTRVTAAGATTVAANGLQLSVNMPGTSIPPVGSTLDVAGFQVDFSGTVPPYTFDGHTSPYQGYSHEWSGSTGNSESVRLNSMGPGVVQYAGQDISATASITLSRDVLVARLDLVLTMGGTPTGDIFTSGPLSGLTFHAATLSGQSTAQFDGFILRAVVTNFASLANGDFIEATNAIVELASPSGGYFSGASSPGSLPEGTVAYWMGSEYQSPSALAPHFDDLSKWFVTGSGASAPAFAEWQGNSECASPNDVRIYTTAPANQQVTLTRIIDGLIPGSWYRVATVAMSTGETGLTVQVRGYGEPQGLPFAPSTACGNSTTPTVFWFKARSPIAYVDFVAPTEGPASGNDTSINVFTLDVERSREPDESYFTTFPDDGTTFNGWNVGDGTVFSLPMRVRRQAVPHPTGGYYPAVEFVNYNSNATLIVPGLYLVSRALRGLVVGESYRVAVQGLAQSVYGNALNPVTYGIGVEGGPEVQVEVDPMVTSGRTDFAVGFTFTATAPNQRIYVKNVNRYDIAGGAPRGLATIMQAATVERMYSEPVPTPDSGAAQRRSLFRVSALTGPTIVEKYNKTCGYMMRVSFGLVAGIPDQYGDVLPIGSAMGGTSYPLGQQDCLYGEPVRRNSILNPSWESATTGWAASAGSYGRYNVFPGAFSGSWFGRLQGLTAVSETTVTSTVAHAVPASPGIQYTLSAYARAIAGQDVQANLQVLFLRSDDTTIVEQTYISDSTILSDDWTRLDFTVTAPLETAKARVAMTFETVSGANFLSATDYMDFDAVMWETGAILGSYFDGNSENGSWTGTANMSASVYTPPDPFVVRDPDCPALPTPPQPPSIDSCGVEEVDNWVRYAIDIPSEEVPRHSSAVPIVTLRTLNSWSNQARLRWYPNPEGLDITQIPPCSFEGEMILSRVPSNSELIIDGISQTATVIKPNGQVAPANHLLYGEAGGPVSWPELRCNQDYVFTVDVDAENYNYTLDVFLSLGLKV